MDYQKSTVIFSSNSVQEVHLKRAQLESEGVPAFVSDDNTSTWFPHLAQAIGGAKLHVAEKFEQQAREILDLLQPKLSCPDCHDNRVVFINNAPFWSTLLSVYFGFPIPVHRQPHYHCSSCQNRWAPQEKEF